MSNLRLKDHTWDADNVYDSSLGKTQGQINAEVGASLAGKQGTLVSGENIKTVNGASILGSGNIEIHGGGTGEDGYSPVVTISNITGGHRVNITDKTHPQGQNFDVMNGTNGAKGDTGDPAPASAVVPAVESWLADNITQETGYVIDTSLTTANAAADAKAVGDKLEPLNDAVFTEEKSSLWILKVFNANGVTINGNGAVPVAASLQRTSRIIIAPDSQCTLLFYTDSEYIGKVNANGGIDKVGGSWKFFTGAVDLSDYAPSNATHFNVCVSPTDGTTLTSETVVSWANAHYSMVAYNGEIMVEKCDTALNDINDKFICSHETQKLINYGYDDNVIYVAPSADRLSYTREKTRLTLNGTADGNSATRIRLTGSVSRTVSPSDMHTGIELTLGHKYRAKWELLSGSVSLPTGLTYPSISIYPVESMGSIGKAVLGLNGYRDFVYSGTQINVYMFIQNGGIAFTNAVYSITIEDLSARDGIEQYYVPELLDTVEKVRALNDEPSLVFPLITDIHIYSADYQNFDRTVKNITAFAKRVKCDCLINMGDTINGNTQINDSLEFAFDCTAALANIGLPYFFSNGNHDNNPYISSGALLFNLSQTYKGFYSASGKTHFNISTNGTDFYVDFDEIGVRLISLNACNNAVHSQYAYGASTAAWLTQALDTDYKVILFEHLSSIATQVWQNCSPVNHEAITAAIQSFVNGGGSLIQLSGHTHADLAFVNPWLSIMQAANKLATVDLDDAGLAMISGYIDSIAAETRTPFTVSEDLWSACVYKPHSNTFHMIRFGSGKDRHFHVTPIAPGTVSTILSGTITWSSSDTTVATVTDGVITGVSSGRCAVLAKDTSGNYECWTVDVE